MRYFPNAKDELHENLSRINPDYRPTMIRKMLPRSAWDLQDREIDQVRHSDCREQINYYRHRAWLAGTVESHGFRCTSLSTRIQPRDIKRFVPRDY